MNVSLAMWSVLFRYKLGELRRAYLAARESSQKERAAIEKRWQELEAAVAAGTAAFTEEDEDGYVVVDWGEQAGEALSENEGMQRVYREAFLISLFHFWERELLRRMKKEDVKDNQAFAFLKAKGLAPAESKLTALRLAANVAKHSEGKSAEKLFKIRPDLFDVEAMKNWNSKPGHEHLLITDEALDDFFDAVRMSGPGK